MDLHSRCDGQPSSCPATSQEGKGRYSNQEFAHFLRNASGSLLELETQLMIAEELEYLPAEKARQLLNLAETVGGGLSGLVNAQQDQAA